MLIEEMIVHKGIRSRVPRPDCRRNAYDNKTGMYVTPLASDSRVAINRASCFAWRGTLKNNRCSARINDENRFRAISGSWQWSTRVGAKGSDISRHKYLQDAAKEYYRRVERVMFGYSTRMCVCMYIWKKYRSEFARGVLIAQKISARLNYRQRAFAL